MWRRVGLRRRWLSCRLSCRVLWGLFGRWLVERPTLRVLPPLFLIVGRVTFMGLGIRPRLLVARRILRLPRPTRLDRRG